MNPPPSSETSVSMAVPDGIAPDATTRSTPAPDVRDGTSTDALPTERREADRQTRQLRACLIPLGGADDIHCVTDDVGARGMHVTVPIGFGVAVGQRYELRLAEPGTSVGMGPLLVGSGHYATVVRTQLRVGEGGQDCIGVGLRFDQPLLAQA